MFLYRQYTVISCMAITTDTATIPTWPRKRVNLPTELMAPTRRMLLRRIANAFLAPPQKLYP